MIRRSTVAWMILLSLILAGCKDTKKGDTASSARSAPPSKVIPVFDSKRAFQYLIAQTNFGPRNPGSVGHQRCLDYLTQELQQFADAVNQQKFTYPGYDGEQLRLTNIIASFNLSAGNRVLLCAHWDTRPRADQDKDQSKRNLPILGANDGASGVAVLLELARQMKQHPPPVGVDIVLFDGEDYGRESDINNFCLGSKYFAANKPQGFNPLFGILLDMVGDKHLKIPKEGYSVQYAADVIDMVWSVARDLGVFQFADETGSPVYDDHRSLNFAGIKTIDLIDADLVGNHGTDPARKYWHTTQDTPDKCSAESLEAVGKVLVYIIYTKV